MNNIPEKKMNTRRSPDKNRRPKGAQTRSTNTAIPVYPIFYMVLGIACSAISLIAIFLPAIVISRGVTTNLVPSGDCFVIPVMLLLPWAIPVLRREPLIKGLILGITTVYASSLVLNIMGNAHAKDLHMSYGPIIFLASCGISALVAMFMHINSKPRVIKDNIIYPCAAVFTPIVCALIFICTVHWFDSKLALKYTPWPSVYAKVLANEGSSKEFGQFARWIAKKADAGSVAARARILQWISSDEMKLRSMGLKAASLVADPLIDDGFKYYQSSAIFERMQAMQYLLRHHQQLTPEQLLDLALTANKDGRLYDHHWIYILAHNTNNETWGLFAKNGLNKHIIESLPKEEKGKNLIYTAWNEGNNKLRLSIISQIHILPEILRPLRHKLINASIPEVSSKALNIEFKYLLSISNSKEHLYAEIDSLRQQLPSHKNTIDVFAQQRGYNSEN